VPEHLRHPGRLHCGPQEPVRSQGGRQRLLEQVRQGRGQADPRCEGGRVSSTHHTAPAQGRWAGPDGGTVRVAVIGLGGIARMAHLPVLRELDDVQIAAVCDRTEVLAGHPYAPGYTDVDQLLDAGTPDAAYVLTPVRSHAPIVRALLGQGVPTF